MASQPALADVVVSTGLTAVSVGSDHTLFEINPDAAAQVHRYTTDLDFYHRAQELDSWEFLLGMEKAVTQWVYPVINNESFVAGLVDFAQDWRPDLVLWEPFTFAGAIAARSCGAAHARVLWGSDFNGYFRGRFNARRRLRSPGDRPDPLGEWLTELASRFGLAFSEDLVVGQWSIDQLPSSFRLQTGLRTIPVQYIPYNGASAFPEWLENDDSTRRVCLTGGFSGLPFAVNSREFSRTLEVLSRFDGEVVLTGRLDDSISMPDNIRKVDFVPLNVLLKKCAAVIHHGGAGTWATALRSGVPQIAVAHEWDCMLRGQQTAELGAGIYLRPDEVDAYALESSLTKVIDDPTYVANARKLRLEALADPTPGEIVPRLEELTRRGIDL